MLLEVLTPLMLAATPATLEVNEDVRYSHEQQMSVGKIELAQRFTTYTMGGTQTFDWNGRPSDNDNDTD